MSTEAQANLNRLLAHAEKMRALTDDRIRRGNREAALDQLVEFIEAIGYVKYARDCLSPFEARLFGYGIAMANKALAKAVEDFKRIHLKTP